MDSNETGHDNAEPRKMDRRDAAKVIAKYAAYTAPAMAVMLNADDAEATSWRRWRRRWRRRHRPSPS